MVAVLLHKKRGSLSSRTVRSAASHYIRGDGMTGIPGETVEGRRDGLPGAADNRPYVPPGEVDATG